MKKFFEKHTIAKMLGIVIFIAIVLTWIIPTGTFNGTQLIKYDQIRIGFNDLATVAYNSIYYGIDKIVYLLVLGGFYAVLSKTDGYRKLVSNIAKKIKGKETLFVIVTSVILTGLTSVTSSTFAMILFVPMLITIMLEAGLNKLTAFASTFGAILVGVLGATFGTETLNIFNQYFSQTLTIETGKGLTLVFRVIILGIATALYNFFLYFASKKALENKKKNEIDEDFKVEEVKSKNVKLFPIRIVLCLLFIVFILGFVNWDGIFKINTFNELHNWLMDFSIGKDFKIFSYILGTSAVPFGAFDLFTLSTVLFVFTILTAILYSVKFDELLTTFGTGALKLIKPILGMVAVYAVFIIMYMSPIVPTVVNSIMKKDNIPNINIDYNGAGVAWFNIDTDEDRKPDYNLMNQDLDNDGKCDLNCDTNKDGYPDKNIDFDGNGKVDEYDESIIKQLDGGKSVLNLDTDEDGIPDVNVDTGHNLLTTMLAATFTNIFQVDLGYTGYSLGGFLVSGYGASHLALVFLVFFAIYGLLQFFIPTSLILIFGLIYTKVEYKDWMKHIWRFVLGMLCVLLIIFIFMSMI